MPLRYPGARRQRHIGRRLAVASRCRGGLLLLALSLAPCAAATAPVDVRHVIPPFNPALDAVHAPAGFGTGKIWHVGPREKYRRPSDVARLVHDGDVVAIDAAVYKCDQSVRWTANNLTLIGVGGQPVLDATGCKITGRKGIWNPSGDNLIVDNIAFFGAKGPDDNDAGIRYDGSGYLYITNAYFRDNQDGILYTPDKRRLATSNLVIDRSEFAHNGIESGQAHNMYITECHSFVLRFSYSHDAIVGHEVKSRADATYILYNRLADEADGTSSYNIDIPQGGLTYIIGNVLQKSADAGNPANISYAVEPEVNPVQKLYVAFNTIVESAPDMNDWHVLFIQDRHLVEARMVDNLIVGADEFSLLQGDAADKVQLKGNVITDQPGFTDAEHRVYSLAAGSPAIGHAVQPGTGSGFPLLPAFQFVMPHDGVVRPAGGRLDVGAYQYAAGQPLVTAPHSPAQR